MSATLPILKAIVTHLSNQCPDWAVELMPNSPSQYYLSHPNGAVLVSYVQGKFDHPSTLASVVQRRELTFVLTVISRDLHNDFGAVALLDTLRDALTGFQPPNCSPCWIVSEAYTGTDEETGIWVYELLIATKERWYKGNINQ